ncbi:MAG TPA: hypothetical protein VFG86_01110 [Chloroflexota bacterium]|jgi:hypothetical protein|nr:hypothetical protein [Chloroflexota bacterium]
MAGPAPGSEEPAQRLPWILIGVIVLLVAIGFVAYFANQRNAVTLSVEGTPSAVARAAGTAGPPPTLIAPTLPPSQPTTTPVPSATAIPTTTPAPAPTALPTTPPAATTISTVALPKPIAQASPAANATVPAATPQTTVQPAAEPTQPPTSIPTATPFAGQVADLGGLGNTRADLQSAYGAPVGETPDALVVFRKQPLEYHVGLQPDLNGRAALILVVPGQQQPWTTEGAMAEARKLLPKDSQPPSAPAEGNNQFIVQRFASQSLAQALGEDVFRTAQAQPGEFLVVYARDPSSGRITRFVIGVGSDPAALLNRAR